MVLSDLFIAVIAVKFVKCIGLSTQYNDFTAEQGCLTGKSMNHFRYIS